MMMPCSLIAAALLTSVIAFACDRNAATGRDAGSGATPDGSRRDAGGLGASNGEASFYARPGELFRVQPFWEDPSPCPGAASLRGKHPRDREEPFFQATLECVDAAGLREGRSVDWDNNTKSASLGTYRQGKLDGRFQRLRGSWDEPLVVFVDGVYVDGKKNGIWIQYSNITPTPNPRYKWTWRNGLLDGPWSISDERGVLIAAGQFVAGRRVGSWTLYELRAPSAVPVTTLEYADGKLVRTLTSSDAGTMGGLTTPFEGELREDGTIQRF